MNPSEFPTPRETRSLLGPIIVADDDADDLFFTIRLVKKTGTKHPLIAFDDGAGVVDYFSRAWLNPAGPDDGFPRLLFLDLNMTGLGGFAFLEWIAGKRELAALHVIVLSGSDAPEDVVRAKALGAKRYLAKHPSTSTFARIIQHVYGPAAVPFARGSDPGLSDSFYWRNEAS